MPIHRHQRFSPVYTELDDLSLSLEAFRVYVHLNCSADRISCRALDSKQRAEICFRTTYPDATPEELEQKFEFALKLYDQAYGYGRRF